MDPRPVPSLPAPPRQIDPARPPPLDRLLSDRVRLRRARVPRPGVLHHHLRPRHLHPPALHPVSLSSGRSRDPGRAHAPHPRIRRVPPLRPSPPRVQILSANKLGLVSWPSSCSSRRSKFQVLPRSPVP
ncbi:hypothetical protein RHSIM_Rhsim07G0225600 [Rhododendron simsii]|uniref:Uncharacterized protein n=1 Tax=Rhododendron simsii TaxID=118357 RepID=A0A834GQG6_RHOSS|nr:hypothetical protein RHSIM_Rhsim07G0225600 [Rhododendron simsii]